MRRLRLSAGAAVVLLASTLFVGAAGTSATASETPVASSNGQVVPAGFGTITQRKVVNSSKTTNYVDKSRQIARCTVATAGLSCSINRTASATRTVNVALGMSRADISAQLGFSSADTVSVGVTCSSGALKAGQSLVAYSVGSRHQYKVNKVVARNGVFLSNETSGWLYAFNPYSAGISCQVV